MRILEILQHVSWILQRLTKRRWNTHQEMTTAAER